MPRELTLDEWWAALAAQLDIDDAPADGVQAVLDLARDAAHGIQRPAAPLTTYLVGLAVGRGASLADAARSTNELIASTSRGPAEGAPPT